MSPRERLSIHTDGASRGNPGDAAFGYVLARDGEPDIEEAGCLGEMTNNQAEYTAIVRALLHALKLGADFDVVLHSDSELLVNQLSGRYRVKSPDLRPLYEQAKELADRFDGGVKFRHVRREYNGRADALCNEALDGLRGSGVVEPVEIPTAPSKPKAAKKTPAKKTPAKKQAGGANVLRKEVVEYLDQVHTLWSMGEQEPTPEEVWARVSELIRQRGGIVPGE